MTPEQAAGLQYGDVVCSKYGGCGIVVGIEGNRVTVKNYGANRRVWAGNATEIAAFFELVIVSEKSGSPTLKGV